MPVNYMPSGYHTITPYIVVQGGAKLIEFLKQVFGAKEEQRSTKPDGTIMHAQIRIGDSLLMLADATEMWKPMPTMLYLYVPDVDATYQAALNAGATSIMAPANQFYGDRNAGVLDTFGNQWWIGTHVEDVPPQEIERRREAALKQRS